MKRMILFLSLLVVAWGAYRLVPSVRAADPEEQCCVVTHVDVMPGFTADGRALLLEFANNSRKDAGAVRIEVFEELSRPNHSTILEIWKSRKAYEDHLVSDQTRAYRTKLQPMLGSPFDERLHRLSQ